jgi:hypothetical protein
MVSSGLLRRMALVRTDVSEEPGASFIRVTKISELGTIQAATSNRRTLRRNTNTTWSGLTRATRRNNPEDAILHSRRRENLKSYNGKTYLSGRFSWEAGEHTIKREVMCEERDATAYMHTRQVKNSYG